MKKQVLVFVCVALLALTVVPVINLVKFRVVPNKDGNKWWYKSVLYNIDFALPLTSLFFYPLGISTNPNKVIIGKEDWLYLGDDYEKTITVTRRKATVEDTENAEKIGVATKAWDKWVKHRGVSLYRVMLGPNKNTIYPEYFPRWAQTANDSTTNTLLAHVDESIYFDTRSALLRAKSQFTEPLYYKTDTHWNSLGAWVAFRAFTKEVAHTEESLRWLSERQISVLKVSERGGGDLSNFLRMNTTLQDSEVVITINSEHPIETEQYDFETGRLTASGGNPQVGEPQHPLLIKSKHALNQKRVLWLRDSFGSAISPFMAATFTETLQLHYGATDSALFARLVDTYKPDYVFITVVERAARGGWFTNLPPMVFASRKPKNFISLSHAYQSGINDMSKVEGKEIYQISGADPFVTFALQNPVRTRDASKLGFELNCAENIAAVQVQVFWKTANVAFSENNSVRLAVIPGITSIDLSPISSWTQAGEVTDVRIDFDSPSTCPSLKINSVELGK
jgi:alginate O-acetyltransferase complex protein AlgJ